MYLVIHGKLIDRVGRNNCINKKDVLIMLTRLYRVPKRYRYVLLKELIEMGIVKLEGKDKVKVMKCKRSLDNSSKIFQDMKMF